MTVAFAFLTSENRKSVLLSVLVVAAAAKEKVTAETAISIRVIVASGLSVDFECKVFYKIILLMCYKSI